MTTSGGQMIWGLLQGCRIKNPLHFIDITGLIYSLKHKSIHAMQPSYINNISFNIKYLNKRNIKSMKFYFADILDQRKTDHHLLAYPLEEIFLVLLAGTASTADSWRGFVDYGNQKINVLRRYSPFKNGIPSKDTFARIMAAINPKDFTKQFILWTNSLNKKLIYVNNSKHIAIDGKTLRCSHNKKINQSPIHMLSAFCTNFKIVLAQLRTSAKSNEITAIPELLKLINIKGHTISIDAMGCQKSIATMIYKEGAEYILALKGNQTTLNKEVRDLFKDEIAAYKQDKSSSKIISTHDYVDYVSGRIEKRECYIIDNIELLSQKNKWDGLKTIIMIKETRIIKSITTEEERFFISSLPADAEKIGRMVRSHWAIENCLHWVLDVVFNEDKSRVRKDHAPANMAIIRHCVMNIITKVKNTPNNGFRKDAGIKSILQSISWNDDRLASFLDASFRET